MGDDDLLELERVGGIGGNAAGLVEFIGGVGVENRWGDFVEVAVAGDLGG